jgi:acyl carrier protein
VESIEESLVNYLQQKFGMRPKLDDSLAMLGVDSVSMAEVTFDIEKMYGITVDAMMSVDTVEDLIDYIRKRQNAPAQKS